MKTFLIRKFLEIFFTLDKFEFFYHISSLRIFIKKITTFSPEIWVRKILIENYQPI